MFVVDFDWSINNNVMPTKQHQQVTIDWYPSSIYCGNSQHNKSAKKLENYNPQKAECRIRLCYVGVRSINDAQNLALPDQTFDF